MLCALQVKAVGRDAPWRTSPLTQGDLIARLAAKGCLISPLLQCPWAHVRIFRRDWLHIADLGVGADWLGNFLNYIQQFFPGGTKVERYNAIFDELQAFYEANEVANRLECLKPSFVENDLGFKLRGSAGTVRAMIPFAWQLAQELLSVDDVEQNTVRQAAYHINMVYSCLSHSCLEPVPQMKEHSTKFALLYVGLHNLMNPTKPKLWRLKPKLHQWLHLCEEGSIPVKTWTYRDEDFGGSVAKAARRRGGMLRPQCTSAKVLWAFTTQCKAVRIL